LNAWQNFSLSRTPPFFYNEHGTETGKGSVAITTDLTQRHRKPDWLRVTLPGGEQYKQLKNTSRSLGLATVCEEARCPNIGECWAGGTATFMLMGEVCTRSCRFCNVSTGNPNGWLDHEEPQKVAQTIQNAGWEYVVLTSVDRDDLPDQGADHFARTVEAIRQLTPDVLVEVLIPDFSGNKGHLQRLVDSQPHVIAHNVETVQRLTPTVRDRRATYNQSLDVLANIKAMSPTTYTKSSLMLGLGETDDEIRTAMADMRAVGVDILTLGQYLQPSPKHLKVQSYVTPEAFQEWQQIAEKEMGFVYCASGPLVRSSYRAGEFFMTRLLRGQQQTTQRDHSKEVTQETSHAKAL
jgi:lipoic acid synthetase